MEVDSMNPVLKRIGRNLNREFGLEAVQNHYYQSRSRTTVTPLPLWWFAMVLVAAIPVSIYSHVTGVTTLPASHPLGALMLVVMLGGIVGLTLLHITLWADGKFRQK